MGNKKPDNKSRRNFFSALMNGSDAKKTEMVKMLTPDGKLVEVEKSIFEEATKKKKATYKEIYDWMNNPSKGNS